MEDNEFKLYLALIRWISLIIITLFIVIAAYNITERVGPVRPHEVMGYQWPNGTPSK